MDFSIRNKSERSAASLQRWVTDKLFTNAEVRSIAKKRKHFDYIISSSASEIVDFLRYIKYESDLDAILQIRLKKNRMRPDSTSATTVTNIYKKATYKFRDLNLYILYINFCLKKNFVNIIKGVFAEGIQYFPTQPDIWILASSFEYERNHNILAARVLLQMGLRYNKHSWRLWHQFFILELKYWHKISHRQLKNKPAALKAEKQNSVPLNDLPSGPDGTDVDLSVVGDPSSSSFSSSSSSSSPSDVPFSSFSTCAVPKMIYEQAVKSNPDTYEFRGKFLEIARKFTRAEPLIDFISNDITETFAVNEQALAAHADLQFRLLGKYSSVACQSAFKVYEHAIKHTGSQVVWSYYVKYLVNKLHSLEFRNIDLIQFLTNKILEVCEKAPPAQDTYLVWIEVLLSTANSEKANKITNRAIKKFPKSASLRLAKIEYLIKSGEPKQKVLKSFERAVKKSDMNTTLWSRYIQWLTMNDTFDATNKLEAEDMEDELDTKHADKAVLGIATRCLKSVFGLSADDFNVLKINLLNTIFYHFGIRPARTFLLTALHSAPTTLPFIHDALALEESQPVRTQESHGAQGDAYSPETIRKIFEEAVRSYGSEPEAEEYWLRYIQFEQKQLNISRASDIYWRAKRTLKNVASFMAKYEEIKN